MLDDCVSKIESQNSLNSKTHPGKRTSGRTQTLSRVHSPQNTLAKRNSLNKGISMLVLGCMDWKKESKNKIHSSRV